MTTESPSDIKLVEAVKKCGPADRGKYLETKLSLLSISKPENNIIE